MKIDKTTIETLRRYLPTIRKIAGWSAEHLADLLDVSRTTVVTLENTENKMSVIQYLAIRKLIDEEVKDSGNEKLAWAVDFLVDRDDVPETAKAKLREDAEKIIKRVGRKAGTAAVSKALGEMKLSDIPAKKIERGKAFLDAQLSKPVITKGGDNHG